MTTDVRLICVNRGLEGSSRDVQTGNSYLVTFRLVGKYRFVPAEAAEYLCHCVTAPIIRLPYPLNAVVEAVLPFVRIYLNARRID